MLSEYKQINILYFRISYVDNINYTLKYTVLHFLLVEHLLDINRGNFQVILREHQKLILPKHWPMDDGGWILVEIIKGHGGHCASDLGSQSLAQVSSEVSHGEYLSGLLLVFRGQEVPVIRDVQLQSKEIKGFYNIFWTVLIYMKQGWQHP